MAQHNGSRKNVLVVDDDRSVRQLVGNALRRKGFDVTLAANGRAGLDHVRTAPDQFDLTVMDYHMPELDGLSACRAMRSCAPGMPIVIMSTARLTPAAHEAGASAFLAKPFDLSDLLNCVSEHIRHDA